MNFRTRFAANALVCLLAALAAWPLAVGAREVRVGIYNNPPKLLPGPDGAPSGILGELLAEVARLEGWTLTPVPCDWEACLRGVENGSIDLMPDVAYNESRVKLFDFHRVAALHSWSQIYAHDDTPIRSMLDLQNRRVAVLQGSVQHEYLTALLAGFGLRTRFVEVSNFEAAFAAVAAGQADAAAVNHHFGDLNAARYRLAETSLMFQPARLFYATTKGRNAELLMALDRRLEPWQTNPQSVYFTILERWGVPREALRVPSVLWWGLGAVSVLLLLALGIVALLRREVARQTRELRAGQDKLATILNSVEAHIFIKDPDLRYQYANRKVCELFGLPLEKIIGRGDEDFFDADTARQLRINDLHVLHSGQRQVSEEVNRTQDGRQQRSFLSVKLPLVSAEKGVYALCGISTDITEQRQFIQEIHQLAYFDSLTHLPNRRQMMERLKQLQTDVPQTGYSHALLLVNIDRFKDLNDTHGHTAGDLLLQQVAQRLSQCVRNGEFVAYLGGDEFAVLATDLPLQHAVAQQQVELLAHKLQEALQQPAYPLGSVDHQVTASLGVALLNDPQASVEAALKHVDLALFQAKARGRGAICFFQPDMAAVVAARAALEADLREGIAQEQFVLYYQPQVDSAQQVFGHEALVRWQHPQRGLVAPDSFIGLAEASGLIEPLGEWILATACRQLVAWGAEQATAHLQVAVNISARQLHHPQFVERAMAIIHQAGANPARLEMELTESHLVEDLDGAIRKMKRLKAHGIRLSLDDFGTGYSSLNYLKRLPLDRLKIDKSFVRDLLIDPHDMSIVKTIIDMGRSLNLSVLAEGVETQAQRDTLAQLGCAGYQGYLFGRPVPMLPMVPGEPAGQ